MSNFSLTNETRFQSLPYITASRLLSLYNTLNHWDPSLIVVNDEMTDLRELDPDGICYVQLNLTTSSISQLNEIDQDIYDTELPQDPLHISITIGYYASGLGDMMVNISPVHHGYDHGIEVNFAGVTNHTSPYTTTERVMSEIAEGILGAGGFDRSEDPLSSCNMSIIS